jgi:hypothetical protein
MSQAVAFQGYRLKYMDDIDIKFHIDISGGHIEIE